MGKRSDEETNREMNKLCPLVMKFWYYRSTHRKLGAKYAFHKKPENS